MVKIGEGYSIKDFKGLSKKLKASGGSSVSFADVLSNAAGSSGAAEPVSSVSSAANVGNLLSLQEVSEEDFARKKNIEHGNNLLKSLEALRQSLLMGSVPPSVLMTLESRLKQQRLMTADPKLIDIIDDIELRAAVELAKYEQQARS